LAQTRTTDWRKLIDERLEVLTGVSFSQPERRSSLGAYFSDRGRLFQADRGRRIGAVGDALGKRASAGLECTSIVHDQSETI